jgi:uncharacterized protein (TIGR01244 family)
MMKMSMGGTVCGVLLLAVFCPCGAQATADKETVPGIAEYTRITPAVAAGGVIEFNALPELKRRGFKAVINLRMATERDANVEAEGAAARAAGLRYIHLPFNVAAPDANAVVDAFLKAVMDPENQPVYVHSRQAHRVGGLWLIKRVIVDGWSTEKALAEAESIALSDSSRQFALEYVKSHSKRP